MMETIKEKKIEILAPAGDLEKLRFAYIYGADAAYVGGGDFSLRAVSGMDLDMLAAARQIAASMGKKLYVAVNIFADNEEIRRLPDFLRTLAELHPDGLIVSDPGVFSVCREHCPQIPLHISTQANNTNWRSARFWQEQGASRIVLARELSLREGAEISALGGLETEVFVHGAICISYSGRCLLSCYFNQRSANKGDCTHPCRWKYSLMEETRPGVYLPVFEDAQGTYIMNSKDLCLIDRVPELVRGAFSSWKIEGRNKSAYYVANTVRIYRQALDCCLREGEEYRARPAWREELEKISHREYTENFALQEPGEKDFRYQSSQNSRVWDFAAILHDCKDGRLWLEQRNYFQPGDHLELILPDGRNLLLPVPAIYDEEGQPLEAARHPKQRVSIPYSGKLDCSQPLICRRQAAQE
ncbi:MAG: U32 family peptidase C-terminal domain-containing protein [Bacillota bacterium]|nr:U32 family peptidase C-terminal domain-containing protein [Bacillota bacterium]